MESGANQVAALLEQFIPRPDMQDRRQIMIRAPAAMVLEVARNFDLESIFIIRGIFRLRAKLLGAHRGAPLRRAGMVADMLDIGWGCLAESPNEFFVAGAACQPWRADVTFSAIRPEQFAAFAEPDRVKVAWTLEAEALEPALTRFATETRVVATDEQARKKFRRYWRAFGMGPLLIRRLLLPVLRRQAERRWQAARDSSHK
jgi:hypothetical protein